MITKTRAAVITPHDSNNLANVTKSFMVSTTGNVKVDMAKTGTAIILPALIPGVMYNLAVKRIYSTNTSATGIIAFW